MCKVLSGKDVCQEFVYCAGLLKQPLGRTVVSLVNRAFCSSSISMRDMAACLPPITSNVVVYFVLLGYLEDWIARTKAERGTGKELLSVNVQVQSILDLMENEGAGSAAVHRFSEALVGILSTGFAGHRIPAPADAARRLLPCPRIASCVSL